MSSINEGEWRENYVFHKVPFISTIFYLKPPGEGKRYYRCENESTFYVARKESNHIKKCTFQTV